MRILSACLLASFAVVIGASANAALMITEVVDATLPGGQPKFVEIKNVGSATVDLSTHSFGNFSNGSTNLGGGSASVLAGSLAPAGVYVISYEVVPESPAVSVFEDTYGFAPDFFMGGGFTNGDDAYALYLGAATGDGTDATLVDTYGVIGVDGTGEVWEYTDGYSFRNPDIMSPNTTFTASEWTFGGANSLETGDDVEELELILELTNPGTHNMVPEPSSVVLVLMSVSGAAAVGMRRRLG